MLFDDIVGQEQVKEQLYGALVHDRVSHAYIICGEKGSGKKTIARQFATALQCESAYIEPWDRIPCGKCHSCKMALTYNHPDIITVNHEKPNTISVAEIRDQVVNDVLIKPYYGRKKVYIIPEAGKMNSNSQNAILKTIEEPPAYAVIILLAENREMLLPTILSRCVSLMMKPVAEKYVRAYLTERCEVSSDEAGVFAAFAHGNIGKAVQIARSESFIQTKNDTLDFLKRIDTMDASDLIALGKNISSQKENVDDMLDIILLWYHDVLMCKAAEDVGEEGLTFIRESGYIETRAERCSYAGIEKIFEAIQEIKVRLKANAALEVCLELLFITLRDHS